MQPSAVNPGRLAGTFFLLHATRMSEVNLTDMKPFVHRHVMSGRRLK